MDESRIRKNNLLWALVVLILPKQRIWINAIDSRGFPEASIRFEARVPVIDVREFAEEGELYAMASDSWHWVGCVHDREWYRFISKHQYDHELKVFAEIDEGLRKSNYSFPLK
jgi:hypothetical protein